MPRVALVSILCTGCLISDVQRRDDLWCDALTIAAFQTPYVQRDGETAPLDSGSVRLLLTDGDALISYRPDNGGRKHIIADSAIELDILDKFGRRAEIIEVIDEHECDNIARRWIVDIEPRDYFLLIDEGDLDIPEVSLFAEDESDLRTTE